MCADFVIALIAYHSWCSLRLLPIMRCSISCALILEPIEFPWLLLQLIVGPTKARPRPGFLFAGAPIEENMKGVLAGTRGDWKWSIKVNYQPGARGPK
jgi:hypothetical protein